MARWIRQADRRSSVCFFCRFPQWLSVANAAFQYYRVLPKAGLVILPSAIWIAVGKSTKYFKCTGITAPLLGDPLCGVCMLCSRGGLLRGTLFFFYLVCLFCN